MSKPPRVSKSEPKTGRAFAALAGILVFAAIGLLTLNVSREIRLLGSANSDNVQWALAQTEVEFLEFSSRLVGPETDLSDLRRKFDVFYSRMDTVSRASVFAKLRDDPVFRRELESIQSFLESSVVIVDLGDLNLQIELDELEGLATGIRPVVRSLSNSGLKRFAETADQQRQAVAKTMTQLAAALALLVGALAILAFYLSRVSTSATIREREQKQTATRMNTVMNTSLDGVIVSNSDGKIIEFNTAAEKIFGYNFEDVVGREIGEIIVPDHMRDAHEAGMERMRAGGEKRVVGKGRVTLEAKRSDGRLFPVELAIQSATTDEGDIFIAFLRDISRRVEAQSELVEARDKALAGEKMKTDFLATMSHEIRTPLNGLLGNMNLLRDTSLDGIQDRYVRNMETSGRLLMSHISDVLDITRYDAGKLSTRSEPVDVPSLLQDIVDSQSSTAAANETTLEWGWDGPAQQWVNSDRDRLQHVLMNLIGNAVKFTKRGKVSLRARHEHENDANFMVFEVQDTGPGIPADLVDHIFDDFVTGNTAYDRDVSGTGLGLSIVRRFVSAMEGEIGVESVVGAGSNFWVRLPVSLADAPVREESFETRVTGNRSLDILLVEDNEINLNVAREMLESEGHRVIEARDGEQAVHAAHSREFDLILMDISMPIKDGRTATREIRASSGASANTTIVALTANAVPQEQAEFLADGMNGILTKPLSKSALRGVLHGYADALHSELPSALVNLSYSQETRETIGDEQYARLLTRFSGEVEKLLAWLRLEEKHDRTDIALRVHKVGGSATVFGATALRDHLKGIENSAKAGDDERTIGLIEQLPLLWAETKSALNAKT